MSLAVFRCFATILALTAIGCSPPSDEAQNAGGQDKRLPVSAQRDVAAAEPGPVLPERSQLIGRWRVERTEPALPPGDGWSIVVTIGAERIDARSQCLPFHWQYGEVAGRLVVAPRPHDGPVCLRPLTFSESAFAALMQAATRIERRDDRLVVSGPRGRVILRPQEAP